MNIRYLLVLFIVLIVSTFSACGSPSSDEANPLSETNTSVIIDPNDNNNTVETNSTLSQEESLRLLASKTLLFNFFSAPHYRTDTISMDSDITVQTIINNIKEVEINGLTSTGRAFKCISNPGAYPYYCFWTYETRGTYNNYLFNIDANEIKGFYSLSATDEDGLSSVRDNPDSNLTVDSNISN
ncbi:hypothetical protein [Sulfurimonas sp.]|jgi:hypothetical protein|uniref:hypothetical protein n=1 Tax=Sulfurimonas sp. TaxID=2022749 RepID=UPI0025DFEEEA|nr:hypothetical protein [Sulfurimonas sp.]MBT5935348.1 hypothetical protein [Sulfurimonas sp.]